MTEAYVALGANLDDRERSLREALRLLDADADIGLLRVSSIYETPPVGYADQPAFLNMAAAVETALEPLELLRRLLGVERTMGRVRKVRWGPRNIDLDLLLYGDIRMDTQELTLPHPRMHERAFVLVPLRDVWAGSAFPWEDRWQRLAEEQGGIRVWTGDAVRATQGGD